jgi:hypothetical protein
MSTEPETTTTDISDLDSLDLPIVGDDELSTGAAADSAQMDERMMALPRLLRYAMLISKGEKHIEERLFAEIHKLAPNIELASTWAASGNSDTGAALAAELDRQAVIRDQSELRSLADCVRLRSLQVPRHLAAFSAHRRVAKALLQLFYDSYANQPDDLRAELEEFCFGWAALPACTNLEWTERRSAAIGAVSLGARMALARTKAARAAVWRQVRETEQRQALNEKAASELTPPASEGATVVLTPEDHIIVAELTEEQLKNGKLKEIVGPLKNIINRPLPLILSPPLHEARSSLLAEFPYAREVIDAALNDLVGRNTIKLRPLLLVGAPGGGKSRFARRLGEVLGVHVWRTDASRSDGAAFAGTDKKWYSAEPCHPFLAIAQAKHANPVVLLDELEKAGTRADYGRLWDCLLGFLESETNARYPDPALQTDLDLSHVSYVATANSVDPLPTPLRDRFRVIAFPIPTKDDLDALLPRVIMAFAHQRGLDSRWISPLDGDERAAVEAHWRGGSVRRLYRIVHAVLSERDARTTRN